MAIKSMTLNEVKALGDTFFPIWEKTKNEIKVSGVAQFRLISLRKVLAEHLDRANEAMVSIAHNCGGVDQQDGSIKIPEEKIPEANRALREMSEETVDIEYSPIPFRDEDFMPIGLMECLIDFLEIKE